MQVYSGVWHCAPIPFVQDSFMRVILFLTLLALQAGAKPNVILILADDLGYADVGVHGCKDIPTPHIDSRAARGVRGTSG